MTDRVMLKKLVWSGVDDETGENAALYEFCPATRSELVSVENTSPDEPTFEGHEIRFASARTGGFHRGNIAITPSSDFSPAELEKLKTIKVWTDVCKLLRARAYNSRARLDEYIKNNPERVKAKKIRHDRKIRERELSHK
jgi:hypothetical protein